ncbi:hypothetical protein SD81_017885 [Tolypothrix campylonemoides VB511288]|nr:hypothetical protein SD81_017885 [Tolypothrix campylonemoides VB511288]
MSLKNSVPSIESYYRNKLAESLKNGRKVEEVKIAYRIEYIGEIDILTDSQVIEVKVLKDWKYALGQVLAYGSYVDSFFKKKHEKYIYILGKPTEEQAVIINKICSSLQVKVEYKHIDYDEVSRSMTTPNSRKMSSERQRATVAILELTNNLEYALTIPFIQLGKRLGVSRYLISQVAKDLGAKTDQKNIKREANGKMTYYEATTVNKYKSR